MKRRWLIRLSVLAILAAFAVWLEPTRIVWGWLRGEAFYQGRPTSYWRGQLRRCEKVVAYSRGPNGVDRREEFWTRDAHWLENRFLLWTTIQSEWPPQLIKGDVDVEALPVLRELVNDPSRRVQQIARWRLEMLEAEDGASYP